MKKINYLAAMALPMMFAACSNEEFATVQEESQQAKEFVGAELIGAGISANFGTSVDSRLVGTTWEDTDKLGLGWVVASDYAAPQDEATEPSKNNLFANHLFYRAEDGGFETKANIYKGWHFAYYPFGYMAELGKSKSVTINPVQTQEFVTDRYNTCLYLSPREFLSREDLTDDYQLNVKFPLVRAFNTIGVTLMPNEVLKGKDVLSSKAIESLTINANGKKIFYTGNAVLNPHNLSKFQYDENGVYDKDKTIEELYKSLKGVVSCANNVDNVTVEVENSQINLSGDQTVRVYVKPTTAVIKKSDITFTIEVAGGRFTVPYTNKPTEELTEVEAFNNTAIKNLVEAYASKGAMSAYGINNGVMGIELQLTEAMLEPTTDAIASEEQWNDVVEVVTALGKKDVIFNIVEGENGPWSFTDVDGDGNLINLPEGASVTVTGKNMILDAEGNWPAEGLTVNTGVVVNANLTVADNVVMTATDGIVNNAIITGGYKSKINDVENNDEIKVIYGTFVKVKNNNYGVISYDVPAIGSLDEEGKELTEARIQQRIQYLIDRSENTGGFAYVNKLYVGEGVDLNLSITTKEGTPGTESDKDPYRPSPDQGATGPEYNPIPGLINVSLEINGGTVTSTNTASLVKAVVNGGTLRNVTLANGLTATDATVEATSIVGGVEATNSTVTAETIEGGLKTTKSTIEVTSSIKGGVEATESTITAETIEDGLTATDATITAEAITGTVVLKGAITINNAEITADVTVENGTTSLNNVNINGDMLIKSGAKVVITGKDTKITNIDNYGELTTNVNVYTETVEIFKGSKAVVAENKTIWYNTPSYGEYGYTQEGNTNGSILYSKITYVSSTNEINDAIAAGDKKIFLNAGEYVFDGSKLTKDTELICANGTVFTGKSGLNVNGATIVGATFSNPEGSAVAGTINGIFKGCTFEGSNAMRYCYAKAGNTSVFEDCVFNAIGVYAIHFDGTTGADIVYKNCKITGWVAIAGGQNSLEFDGCEIYGNGTYGLIRTYGAATIKNCTFDVDNVNKADEYQDGIHAVDCVITVENCVNVNGNIEALFNTSNNGEIIKK